MSSPFYPSALPYQPLRDAYDVPKRHQAVTATEMEDGPKRQRRTATSTWSQHAYQIVMTLDQFDVFDAFVRDQLGHGAGRFYMPVGRIQRAEPWPSKLVYIEGGDYSPKPHADGFVVVSFTLNVLDW